MSAPDPVWLIEEFRAFERALALRTAIEMELFTQIGAGANTIEALAADCGSSERGIRALCDYLTMQGHLAKRGGRYSLTLNSRLYLTTESPAYLGGAAKFLAGNAAVASFCRLRETIKRGASRRTKLNWVEYARSMAPLAQPFAEFAAAALKVKSAGPIQVLDIAAGHGLYGLAIAEQNRSAQIFALDSPEVLKVARENARQAGVVEGFHAIPGDAFKASFAGPYDLTLAANFTHHLDAASNLRLFRKCRAALKPAGRMVVIDFILNPDRVSPSPDASFALTLLATSVQGNVYTLQEYSSMLRAAGFRRVRRMSQRGLGRWMVIATR